MTSRSQRINKLRSHSKSWEVSGSLPQFNRSSLLPIALGLIGAISLPQMILPLVADSGPVLQTLVSLLSIWVSFAFAYYLFRTDISDSLKPFQTVKSQKPIKTLLGGVLLGFGLQLLLVFVGLLIIVSFGFDPTQVSNLRALPIRGDEFATSYSIFPYVLMILGAAVIAPVMEELFFRGVVLPVVSARLGTVAGVSISAVAFGLMHVQATYESTVYMVILTTIAGAAFGFMRIRYKSLLLPMAVHIGFNSWALLITLVVATLL